MWRAEIIGAWVVLLLGLFIVVFSIPLKYYTDLGPGAGFLPFWIGVGIVIGGVVEVTKAFRIKARTQMGTFLQPRSKLGLQMLVLIVITFVIFPFTGFSVGLALCTAAAMRFIGKHKMMTCVITAALSAIFIHVVFAQWLDIPLPMGLIGW
ncbi:MAG: tripartite tricarboxylate transporter TctB family protein [Deltaproteobacteria bacterium]|nr:tripartite tricarboxylate transporter TctB family protein [Deltaproteobacteria bacterium]